MKIKMLTISAGPDGVFHPGAIRTVSKEEGEVLIKGKFAVEVADADKPKKGSK